MKIALVVHANPFAALDHIGRAQCAVYHPGTTMVVGGAFDFEAHEASKAESVSGEGKHRFTFTTDPVNLECSIPEFAYFRRQVQDGSLLAGDEATAKKCGVDFVEPAKALAAAKDAAIALFKAAYGKDAVPECAKPATPKTDSKSAAKPAAKE